MSVAVDGEKKARSCANGTTHTRWPQTGYYYSRYNTSEETIMYALKLTQIGNSVGVVLPKEALAMLHVDKGDTVYLVESPDGFSLTPYDPEVAKQVEAGREFMREYRDTFHELAK
jgi:putative addiction module antidote